MNTPYNPYRFALASCFFCCLRVSHEKLSYADAWGGTLLYEAGIPIINYQLIASSYYSQKTRILETAVSLLQP